MGAGYCVVHKWKRRHFVTERSVPTVDGQKGSGWGRRQPGERREPKRRGLANVRGTRLA
jgi:hypothetical protein